MLSPFFNGTFADRALSDIYADGRVIEEVTDNEGTVNNPTFDKLARVVIVELTHRHPGEYVSSIKKVI